MTLTEFNECLAQAMEYATSHHEGTRFHKARIELNGELWDIKEIQVDQLMGCGCGVGIIIVAEELEDD